MPPPQHKTMRKQREEERFNVYIQHIRRGKFHSEACRLAKVKPEAVRLRLRTDPQFRQDVEEAHSEFSEKVEGVLVDAAFGVVHWAKDADGNPVLDKNGNPVRAERDTKAALEWLKARNSSIFNPNKTLDVNVKHSVELPFQDFQKLRAELEARRPAQLMPGQDYEDIVEAELVEED
jgi:hypothetical protein